MNEIFRNHNFKISLPGGQRNDIDREYASDHQHNVYWLIMHISLGQTKQRCTNEVPTHQSFNSPRPSDAYIRRWISTEMIKIMVYRPYGTKPLSKPIITLTSWWSRWRLKSPASRLFAQSFIQAQIKENIKVPRHWPLCGEFTRTGEIPAQRVSNAENVSIWWRHHDAAILPWTSCGKL